MCEECDAICSRDLGHEGGYTEPSPALHMSHCQNSSKFLSVSYFMKTADAIINFFSSHDTTDHTC